MSAPPTAPPWTLSPGVRETITRSSEQPAVDGVHGACDVSGLVLEQEAHHSGDFFWAAQAVYRDLVDNALENLLRDGADHLGLDDARGQAVDGYALSRSLQR